MAALETETDEDKRILKTKIETLSAEKENLEAQISDLKLQVSSAPPTKTFDKMKREIRLLRRLEYNASPDDDDKGIDDDDAWPVTPAGADSWGDEQEDLESVLVSRLRRAEDELIGERRERAEAEAATAEEREKVARLEEEKDADNKLVAALETDLAKAISVPNVTMPINIHTKHVNTIDNSSEPAALLNIIDPTDPAGKSAGPVPVSSSSNPANAGTTASDNIQSSVVNIVMKQRDRLREKLDSIEMEKDGYKRELQLAVKTSETLKIDNVKLYEKVRYMQNFVGGKGGAARNSSVRSGRPGRYDDTDLDLESLEKKYESSVDPFQQFGVAERQRKFREMTPVERMVYFVARFTLANKEMRTALFLYVLLMHALVFLTTYHWSHTMSCDLTYLKNHEDLGHLHHGPPILGKDGLN